jgi:flagellar hook-associated protein 3 FlgL
MSNIAIGRVSNQLHYSLLTSQIDSQMTALSKVEQQISTGNRLALPSDDPSAAVGIISTRAAQDTNTQYTSALNFVSGFLGSADSSLSTLSGVITQAQSIANGAVGSTSTADDRAAQGETIDSMLQQVLTLANTRYNGSSVFGGANGVSDAFAVSGGGYKYQGSTAQQGVLAPDGSTLDYTVDGSSIFGGTSAQVTSDADISPALTSDTTLQSIGGATGNGFSGGKITINYGTTSVNVDLSTAATAGDVVSTINSALSANGIPATVALNGNGFKLTNTSTTDAVTISDPTGSTTAATLGLDGAGVLNGSVTGSSVQPKITATTPLSALRDGLGVDPSGLVISNGSSSATVSLTGLSTVGDLLNAINGSGVQVSASITPDGTGISVQNPVSGSSLTIGENGGTTASDLGIRSLDGSTKLSDLNGGSGVTAIGTTATGPTGHITITKTDGTTFQVSVAGVTTPSGLVSAINSATGHGDVTAALNASGNGITLTDTTGGGGNVAVSQASDYNSNGSDLGIFSTGTGGTLTGNNITLSTDDFRVTRKDGTSFTVNLNGTTTVQDVLDRINNADGNTGANKVTAALSSTGNGIVLNDSSTGMGSFSVTALNGSTALSDLGLSNGASGSTITGDDVNPIEPEGIFNSLIQLRNALNTNDTAGIERAAAALTKDATRVTAANGVIGAREQDVQARQTIATNEGETLTTTMSNLADTDTTTAITQLQSLETSYQATLQVASTQQNLSLFDFLS